MELFSCYVHTSYVYQIYNMGRDRLVRLDRKHIDAPGDGFESRYIGAIPDSNWNLADRLCMVWPQAPMGEVKFLIESDGKPPILIKTGIISQDLLDESGWVDNSVLG